MIRVASLNLSVFHFPCSKAKFIWFVVRDCVPPEAPMQGQVPGNTHCLLCSPSQTPKPCSPHHPALGILKQCSQHLISGIIGNIKSRNTFIWVPLSDKAWLFQTSHSNIKTCKIGCK